ncbi:MAG TPA: 6-phosphogluconolactonase [Thermoanaerobaculia bacterium]|nr:6-phosphogluconolactonase [Thermoanaerobaculia bacterium]
MADAVASVRPAAPASFEIAVLPDADSLALAAADEFARSAADAVSRRGLFHVALSGGSTPRALYRRLTKPPHRGAIPWDSVRFFFGDERCVPPGDDRSNYRMAREALFKPLRIAPRRVFRVRGEDDPARAAREYERLLRAHVPGRPPRLDLVLLGLGEDGHTASLFPGTPALTEGKRLAVENPGPRPGEPRITLTYRAIDSARRVIFLVSGSTKAKIAAAVLAKRGRRPDLPAARVAPRRGTLLWLLDEEAGSRL